MAGPRLARAISALGLLALAGAYFITARAGLTLATVGHSVSLVWPPSGVAIAALHIGGTWLWPGVALGAFAVNALTPGVPLATAAAMAAGNTGGALVATGLLRLAHFDPAIRRVADVARLVGLAALLSTGVSAIVGTLALRLGGVISIAQIALALRVWWIGDLMGVLIVAPFLWTLRGITTIGPLNRWRVLEATLLAAVLLALAGAVFSVPEGAPAQGYLRSYVVFPPLLWAALRFEARGAAWANLVMSALAIWGTVNHTGPFASPPGVGLLNLQVFMAIAAVTSLMLAAAAAERSDAIQAREDFISIASHELRTPLTPLTLQIDRLGRRLMAGRESPDDLNAIQISLQRQTDRLTGLVDILLDITRLRTGRMTLDRETVDLAALARETVDGLKEELARASCTVTVAAPQPVQGSWDRTRLVQALTNLLSNAAKYAPGAPVAVSVSREASEARLVVADGGPGIAPAEQSRLFRRFARLPSTGPRTGGLGLGLYITREILEAHGGTIRLESRPGHGASFICTLPLPQPGLT